MRELQSLLARREATVGFDCLNHRVRCYAHIINVCSSHIVASVTSPSKSHLSKLGVPIDPNYAGSDDSENESDSDVDPNRDIDELQLADCYDGGGNANLTAWFSGVKRDPLKRARRIIRLLRSSDQRREGFRAFVETGNKQKWFTSKDSDGKRVTTEVPELQPLRDVKTRWDSVYTMLHRLRQLRPVRSFRRLVSGN